MSDTATPWPAWTCPFCPLACDHVGVRVAAGAEPLALLGDDCPRAAARLATFPSRPAEPQAEIDGRAAPADAALAAAARILAAASQPLFAGLGTDVAGARALYPLACATGAIVDAAGGDALMQGLRALQDRGQFTTTLAEVRTRADLIVFVGGVPSDLAPLLARRLGIGEPLVARRHLVSLAPPDGADDVLSAWAGDAVGVETIAAPGADAADGVRRLLAALARPQEAATAAPDVATGPSAQEADAGRAGPTTGDAPPPTPADDAPGAPARDAAHASSPLPAALAALAARLRGARYAVLVGAPARLGPHAALAIEAVHALVGHLNRTTRAAALWIGGGDGAATANQVFAWLSGLPLRSRAGPLGLEHEPLLFGADRLLADRAVDALLWVSSFDAAAAPPAHDLPTVVLGHPAQAAACRRSGTVFIPVATPGIGDDGHLFRTDGTVLMPLHAVRPDPLPSVANVARALLGAVEAARREDAPR